MTDEVHEPTGASRPSVPPAGMAPAQPGQEPPGGMAPAQPGPVPPGGQWEAPGVLAGPGHRRSRTGRALAAEIRKLLTVWSTPVIVAVGVVLTVGLGVLVGYATGHGSHARDLLLPARGTASWFDSVFSVMTIAQDLALIVGVVAVTAEFRHRTVTATFLVEPRRGNVVAAKLGVAALAGATVAVAAAVGDLVLGAVFVATGNGTASTMLTELGHVAPGVVAASALFGIYGVGLGALLRNQVAALVVGLGVTVILEPIVRGIVPGVGKWFPSAAAQSLDSVTAHASSGFASSTFPLLSPGVAAAVLLGYGVVLAIAGALTTLQADIT